MKRTLLNHFLLLVISLFAFTGGVTAQEFVDGKQRGVIRVKMSPVIQSSLKSIKSTRSGGVETGIVAFDAVSSQVAANNMQRVFRYSPRFEERHQAAGLHLWYEIQFDKNLDPAEVANQYRQLPEVQKATIIPEVNLIGAEGTTAPAVSSVSSSFNDPHLGKQWHYNNDGSQSWAEAGADINLAKAWEIETGSSDVIVAIIDGGVQADHPDLEEAMWTNDAELNGLEGIDDDGNGFVDDIYGYNFCLGQGELVTHYHGTHVAGTVGAVNNNNTGVAGIAGGDGNNPGVRLMSCQIFTEDGAAGGYAEAIVYAADMGAVISQNSWGWSSDGYYEESVLEAIDYFNEQAGSYSGSPMKGGVSIFAAGNLGYEIDIYPAAYEPCIAVASMGPDFKRASYSVYADWVDITAPGGNTNLAPEAGVYSTYRDGAYSYLQGTSMACPHVSGIAALVVSKYRATDFTADQLKQHLLTSVHDIEPYLTEKTAGKMGNGYIDAYMALQSGDASVVPNRISSFSIETSQDFATYTWNVPADADDEKAVSYNLYWSKEPFTEANLQSAGSKVVNAFFVNVGDELINTVQNLDAQTEYYFAIKAFDRWGNGSELSDVIMVMTNSGPEIVMGEELNVDIDVRTQATSTQTYSFENIGEGVMDWRAHIGLDSLSLTPFASSSVVYPNFNTTPVLTGIGSEDLVVDGKVAAPFYEVIDERLKYVEYSTNATKIIGENDTTITNSAATWYKVEETEGYNLTHMWLNLKVNPETGPIVVEVWKGTVLREAELISSQNYTTETAYWTSHYVELEEQIHFNQGDIFWTVVHVPSGNLYPLGIAEELEEEQSDRCFMSFNGGASWSTLASVINKDNYVWSWVMRSTLDDIGDYISIAPTEGILASNESQDITVDIDASNLIDGYYEENIVVISNDPKNKVARGKVKFTVDGHAPELNSVKTVDFGNVFVDQQKTFDIQVVNNGLRGYQLLENGYTSSNPDIFIAEGVVSGETIPALADGWVRLTFAPNAEGTFNSTVTLTDEQGYTYSFSVHGIGVIPANIVVADTETGTDEYTVPTDLTVGDAIANRTFTITNDGKYPLHYKVPKFAPEYEVEGLVKPINNYGYTYDYMLTDQHPEGSTTADKIATHNWVDISSTGTKIDGELRGPAYAVETEIGFSFPFRDRFYNKVWINEQGALIFGEEGDKNLDWASGSSLNPNYLRDYDMITATMMRPTYSDNSAIYYHQEDGMFRVFYKNIKFGGTSVGVDLQIVLHASGDVDVLFYKSVYVASYLIGIVDKDNEDVAFIHNSDYPVLFSKGTTSNSYHDYFHFYHPGENMISNVTNPSGTVQPGEAVELEVSFNTENVLQDAVYERLAIVSNDPDLPVTKYTINANFVAGGTAQLVADETDIDFGDVFKTDEVEHITTLTNSGTADILITDIQFGGADLFSCSRIADLPITVKARQSVHIPVKINTGIQAEVAAGLLEDVMTLTDEAAVNYTVNLTGNVVENPLIRVTPEAGITHTMNAGETFDTQITVYNDGDGELEYAVVPTNWYYLKNDLGAATSEFKEFDYTFVKGDGAGWTDITESAASSNLESKFLDDNLTYFTLPLKNEYIYYGETYNTLYIGLMGWVSFIEPGVQSWQERPTETPQDDNIPGAISPMAAFHLPYYYSISQKQGLYYQEEDDRLIVSWEDYVPVAGIRSEYSFQVIIHQNGNIDFNYRNLTEPNVAALIGVEHPNQADGLMIWRDYMPSGIEYMSYTVSPVEKKRVAPNSSAVVDLTLDASDLYDGVYTSDLVIVNNTVGGQAVTIPVELTVNGAPNVEAIGNDAGLVWYVAGESYEKEFTIRNTGTKTVYFGTEELTGSDEISVSYRHDPVYYRGMEILEAGLIPVENFVGQKVIQTVGRMQVEVADGTELAPGDSWNMVLQYTPAAPSVATANLKLIDADLVEALNCILTIESKMPPAITVSDEVVTVNADVETYTTSRDLVIGNVNGSGDLEWNIEMVFNRGKEIDIAALNEALPATNKAVELSQGEAVERINTLKAAQAVEYNRTLAYTDAESKENNIGFGAGLAFMSGTKLKAPADGFLLSNVETFYIRESVLSGVITVEIRAGGNNINDAIKIGKGQISLSYDEPDATVGDWVNVELDESVYIYPNEAFYVIFTYPLGVTKPQGVVYSEYDDIIDDRFFFNYEDDWFDIVTQSGVDNMMYMVRAHEEKYEQKTWLSIDADQMSGVTAVGQESTIQLKFDAANAQELRNNAEVLIHSNDPLNETMLVDVNLLMNEAPVVTLVEGNQKVEETHTETLRFEVSDNEGDSFTNECITDAEWIAFTDNNSEIVATLTPGYDAQGIHQIEIISTDEHGVKLSSIFDVQVINVNRAPEFAGAINDTTVVLEHGNFEIEFTEVINDIDNDKMTYTFEVANEDVLELMLSDNRAVLKPVTIGSTEVSISGRDEYGARIQTSYTINVVNRTGLDDNQLAGVEVYPNPARDVINITWFDNVEEANIRLMSSTGELVMQKMVSNWSSETQLNIGHLNSGVYMLELKVDDEVFVQKVIKQ
ncbi:S8 family serine peptidase [Carboxylicivirga sp. A043]|uniref:subtilase family N-terminal domain-containing protein n=1 Tax=Carboxylicivirga litoralis TaxID=2816963 RepID=UPI0021CB0BE8|nr:subtilase family N-terminal domain-containing protein [Carboxylicivirga sp. A043]MCU4155052.1 S8 family serine peptidase [Carboxylicivirga sp. A043]